MALSRVHLSERQKRALVATPLLLLVLVWGWRMTADKPTVAIPNNSDQVADAVPPANKESSERQKVRPKADPSASAGPTAESEQPSANERRPPADIQQTGYDEPAPIYPNKPKAATQKPAPKRVAAGPAHDNVIPPDRFGDDFEPDSAPVRQPAPRRSTRVKIRDVVPVGAKGAANDPSGSSE